MIYYFDIFSSICLANFPIFYLLEMRQATPLEKILEWKSEDLGLSSYYTTEQFVIMSEIYFKISRQL